MTEWKETRLKNLLAIPLSYGLNVSSEDDREDWPRYIRITDFDDFDLLSDETFKSLPMSIAEPALLKDGDLLFARSGATAGKTFLYSSLPNGACYAGYLIRARFKKNLVNPKFVSYFTKGTEYCNWKNRYCIQTTIQNISADKYNQLPISIPSLSVQQRIVDYLDEKLAKIDERIAVLEKQQDAYVRLKKSVIHQAVTRGLNPNVPLKDSGVDWIGMIPEHWEVKRIKDVMSINTQVLPENTPYDYMFKYIDIGNVSSDGKITIGEDVSFYEAPSRARRIIKRGDVLVSTVRTYLRAIARVDFEANDIIASTGFAVLSPKTRVDSAFVVNAIRDIYIVDAICSLSTGVSYPAISALRLSSISFAIPPLTEQQAIANYLDDKCTKIDAVIENIGKQIDASKRLKRALINEVITGQRAV
jgi:type I restriction enzyme S subunit